MEIYTILIGLGMLGVSIHFVILPFWQKPRKNMKLSAASIEVEGRRVATMNALRDLDFDHKIGKVGDEDYAAVRAALVAEASRYIQQQAKEDDKLEALIQARKASQGLKCSQCDAPIETGSHFCPQCGTPVERCVCPSCGKNIQAGDLFCPSCGSQLKVRMEATSQS
jgi:rRNA maturation endonuclease Nob1